MRRTFRNPIMIMLLLMLAMTGASMTASTPVAAAAAAKKATISSIPGISIQVKQNEKCKLPATVSAIMSDKTKKNVPVKWNPNPVDTSKAGVKTCIGSVSGYKGKVKLTVNVMIYIRNIDDLEVAIEQNGKQNLPKTLAATMSDGNTKEIAIDWNKISIDDSKIGANSYQYMVSGYDKQINIKITVEAYAINIKNINETVKQFEKFALPSEVGLDMSDGSTKFVSVKWDKTEIDTSKPGTYSIYGTIDNFRNKAILNLIVEKLTVQDIAKESRNILFLKIYNAKDTLLGTGSGFLISSDGIIVTNYHVIESANYIEVRDSVDQKYEVDYVMNYDRKRDIAILKINTRDKFDGVRIGDSDVLTLGQEVVAIGSPKGLQNTVSNGLISSIRSSDRAEGAKDIQISAPISSGSSGGALFNMNGEVVGITYAGIENGQNLNFAIPINEIKLLSENKQLSLKQIYEKENVVVFDNGKYEGDTTNGIPDGYGTIKWNSGATYVGEWVDGYREGYGTYTWANGDLYTGQWVKGIRAGIGMMKWTDGEMYEGEYVNDEMHGYGIYVWADGERHEGIFKNGDRNGFGKITMPDGKFYYGTWLDDKQVTEGVKEPEKTAEFKELPGIPVPVGMSTPEAVFSEDKKQVYYVYTSLDGTSYCEFLIKSGFRTVVGTKDEDGDLVLTFERNGKKVMLYHYKNVWVVAGDLIK